MGRKLISLFLIAWMLLMIPVMAFAQEFDPNRTGSISVTLMDPDGETPVAGAELSLYHVAAASLNSNDNLSYTFTAAFADCGCALDDPDLTAKLDAFLKDLAAAPETSVTDAQGKVTFSDLPLGLYFVKQTKAVAGYAPCTPFLVTVPSRDAEGYVYDVNASPKTDIARLTAITVKKAWNTDASTKIPDHVTVQLLRDGAVVETATLNERNNWQITYTDMPQSDGYTIKEVNVPRGFTATYSQSEYVFTVTNTASLIQTGQLLWPIPVLAMAGLCLIAVGVLSLRKAGDQNA